MSADLRVSDKAAGMKNICFQVFNDIADPLIQAFFANVAKARTVKTILQQCYGDKSTVTDELVEYVRPHLTHSRWHVRSPA